MTITKDSLAATASLRCPAPDVSDLTEAQQAALHVFKNKCLASLYRLYMTVPAERANPIIEKLLPTLING